MTYDYKNRKAPHDKPRSSISAWLMLSSGLAIGLFVAFLIYITNSSSPITHVAIPAPASKPEPKPAPRTTPAPTPATTESTAPLKEPTTPTFSFYSELPKMEIEVPPIAEPLPPVASSPLQDAPEEKPLAEKKIVDPPKEVPVPSNTPSKPAAAPAAPKTVEKISPSAPTVLRDESPPTVKKTATAYLLQVGSFANSKEADALRAQLAFMGLESSIQAHTINAQERRYRVRIGPYTNEAEAKSARLKLQQNNITAIMVKLGP